MPQAPLSIQNKERHVLYVERCISQWTKPGELKCLVSKPIPSRIGLIQATLQRSKSAFNFMFPKYTLRIKDKPVLYAKKVSSATKSKTLITCDAKLTKNAPGYLGKLNCYFLSSEHVLFDCAKGRSKTQ